MTTEKKTAIKVFTFLDDDIRAGEGDINLPGSDELSGVIKRYAAGGENRMHSHPTEDHTFYVLEGEGTFHLDNDANVLLVGRNEAVHIPRGSSYWFESSGAEKLIILRTGTQLGSDRIIDGKLVPSQRTTGNAKHLKPKELPF
jgi:mannose-6-phosphate isomerase-like protein (cupin superfamily)